MKKGRTTAPPPSCRLEVNTPACIQLALDRHDDTVNACNRLLSAYPESDLEDEARILLGQALFAGRRPELSRMIFQHLLDSEAGFVYQRLIKRYPDSPEANRARMERPLLE